MGNGSIIAHALSRKKHQAEGDCEECKVIQWTNEAKQDQDATDSGFLLSPTLLDIGEERVDLKQWGGA